jgi:hypothetical protein
LCKYLIAFVLEDNHRQFPSFLVYSNFYIF